MVKRYVLYTRDEVWEGIKKLAEKEGLSTGKYLNKLLEEVVRSHGLKIEKREEVEEEVIEDLGFASKVVNRNPKKKYLVEEDVHV